MQILAKKIVCYYFLLRRNNVKTAAKVFVCFGIVFGFYLIFPLIVGIFALNKLNNCESKQELHNFGVITLLFCSFLGGLFMMLIDEPQMTYAENSAAPTYPKDSISNTRLQNTVVKHASISTIICFWLVVALSVILLILSILIIVFPPYYIYWDYYGYYDWGVNYFSTFMTTIPIWCNTIIILIPFCIFLVNKQRFDKKCGIAFIFYLIYVALTFSLHISSAAITVGDYRVAMMWIVPGLSFTIFILTLVIIIINKSAFKPNNKSQTGKTQLETELDNVKCLYEKNIISQSEYEKIRQTIIEKYGTQEQKTFEYKIKLWQELLLCGEITDKEYEERRVKLMQNQNDIVDSSQNTLIKTTIYKPETPKDKLKHLQSLLLSGEITDEEYEERRVQLLKNNPPN